MRAATCSPLFFCAPNNHPFVEAVTIAVDKRTSTIKAPIIPLAFVDITYNIIEKSNWGLTRKDV